MISCVEINVTAPRCAIPVSGDHVSPAVITGKTCLPNRRLKCDLGISIYMSLKSKNLINKFMYQSLLLFF